MQFASQRSRHSGVGSTPRQSQNDRPTPGPSRQSAASTREASTYETPSFSLNPAGQRALAALISNHSLRKLHTTLTDAQTQLGEAAMDINDRLHVRDEPTAKVREKRRRDDDPEQEDDGTMQEMETELTEMREKVNGLNVRIEEKFRKLIDGKQSIKWMTESVNAAAEDARNNASTQASTLGTRSQRTRRTRGAAEDDDEEEQDGEDEEIAEFQPTDPAAGTQPERAPLAVFKKKLKDDQDQYQAASYYARYAQDNDYINFKRTVHDALHPDDDVQLAPATEWFNDDGTVAAPGQTRPGGDADDSDDDIQTMRATTSTKCPLTLKELEDVVTAVGLCNHSFERAAIYELIAQKPANHRVVQCPVGGCRQMLEKKVLQKDPVVVRRIQRLQRAKATQAEASDDDDDDFESGTQRTAQTLDSDDDDEGVQAPKRDTQRSVKREPRTTATPGPSGGLKETQGVIDLGDDDEDEPMDD